jgi:hypothetical protein
MQARLASVTRSEGVAKAKITGTDPAWGHTEVTCVEGGPGEGSLDLVWTNKFPGVGTSIHEELTAGFIKFSED